MGHTIYITIPEKDKDGKLAAKENVDVLSISYNWGIFRKYFHISDVNGYNGAFVEKKILEAFEEMKKDGYDESYKPRVDGWGQPLDKSVKDSWDEDSESYKEYEKDRLCMFGEILTYFLEKARAYPRGHWFSDCIDDRIYRFPDGEKFEEEQYEEQEEPQAATSSSCASGPFIPIRHPVKGTFVISSLEDAKEIYEYYHDIWISDIGNTQKEQMVSRYAAIMKEYV